MSKRETSGAVLTLVMFGLGLPSSTIAQTSGLVAAYSFNENTGSTVTDLSGNNITGTALGTNWSPGKYGSGLSFNGSSCVDLGNPTALQLTGSFTAEAWVNATADPSNDGIVVAKSDNTAGWQFKTSPDTGPFTFGVAVSAGPGSLTQRYSTIVRSLNTWYHIAGVYDSSAGTLSIYVNGTLNNGVLTGIVPASQVNASVNVNVGCRTGGYYFKGIIDEVRIYNRALSQTEIQTDMNTPLGGSGPDVQPPTAPTSLTANAVSGTQINLSWTAATDNVAVTGYQIERCLGTGCTTFAQIAMSTATAYSDAGVLVGNTYNYRVRATDAANNLGPYSNTATASTASSSGASATFLRTDTTSQGNWKGVYGVDGYNLINDTTAYPAYVTATPSGVSPYTWAGTTTDVRGLQKASVSGDRIAACWYAGSSMSVDLRFTDTNTHQVAFYLLDFEAVSRINRVDILDASNNLLDSRTVSNFSAGQYWVWNLSGHVIVRFTNVGPGNAVVSGIFFGSAAASDTQAPTAPTNLTASAVSGSQINLSWTAATDNVAVTGYQIERCLGTGCTSFAQIATATATTYGDAGVLNGNTYNYRVRATDAANNLGPYSNTATASTASSSGASATFLRTDTTSQGNWKGVYGVDGYNLINDTTAYPAYVTATPSGVSPYTWAGTTTDVRGLQKASVSGDRIAACWYAGSSMSVDLRFTDTNTHQVAFYLLDFEAVSRINRVDILDASNNVLDSRTVSNFSAGQYWVWNLSGHVIVRLTNVGPGNAVVSGIFFGTAAGSGSGGTASFLRTDTASQGNWKGVYGVDGYNLINDTTAYPAYVTATPSGVSPYTWAGTTTDVRGLQKASVSGDRIAACWYAGSSMSVDLRFTDTNTHQVAFYLLDFEAVSRINRVDILDASNNVLDSRTVSNFSAGQYWVWNLSGHVIVRFTNVGPGNAVVSGIFLGSAAASDTQAPTAPTNLTAAAVSGSQINLSWTAATDNVAVAGYQIERCLGTGCTSFAQIATSTAAAYSDAGVLTGNSYNYRVRATDASNNLGPYSNTATASTSDTQAPTAPTNLTASAVGGSQINLSWTAATDNVAVTGYLIERCLGTGCTTFAQVGTAAGTAFNDTGLIQSTSYSYRLRATDATGNLSAYSSVASATTQSSGPSSPPVFSAENHSATDGDGSLIYNNSSLSVNVTGTNNLLIAAWHSEWDGTNGTAPTPPCPGCWSVSCNGVPGTLLVQTNGYTGGDGNGRFRIYYWLNPTPGLNTVTVANPNTGPNELAVSVILLSNVAQTSPLGDVKLDVSTVARTSESETVNTTTSDLVLHVIADALYTRGTLGSGETSVSVANDSAHTDPGDGDASLWISTKAGGVSSTTLSSSGWADSPSPSPRVINGVAIVVHGAAAGSPTALSAVAVSSNQISLSWTAPANFPGQSYLVEQCQGSACTAFVQTGTAAGTTYNTIGLTPATSYSYRVRATDAAGNLTPYSNTATATTNGVDTQSPTAPGSLSAGAVGTQVNLSWTAATDNVAVTGYQIERCLGTGCTSFAQIATSTATAYSDASVLAGNTYNYHVRATDAANNLGPYSNTATASTVSSSGASATFLRTDTTSQGNWKSVYGVDGYNVINDTAAYPSYVTVTPDGFAPYTWAGTTTDVRGLQKASVSGDRIAACWYAWSSMNVDLRFTDTNTHQVAFYLLDFEVASRINRVDILDASNNLLDSRTVSNFSAGQYWVWNLSGHVIVRFTNVGPGNALVSGIFFGSAAASDTQAPAAPTSLTASAVSGSQINLSWTAATDNVAVAGYQIERCLGTGCTSFAQIATATATVYSDAGILAGNTYNYRVRATDAANNQGPYSNTATSTTQALDNTPPVISSVAATVTDASATITWTTDEPADTKVNYGLTSGNTLSSPLNSSLVTSHSLTLSGLSQNTVYHYQVASRDGSGNLALSGDFVFTTAATQIHLGVMGDSMSDEYRADDNRGGTYAPTTLNWLELLVRYRNIDAGVWGTWPDSRRTGYEYNWALSGATAAGIIAEGQHTGLAAQVAAGKVNTVVLYVGANDFSASNGTYAEIYNGTLSGSALQQKLDTILASISTAIDTVQASGTVKVIVSNFVDSGNTPVFASQFPDASRRQLVTNAILAMNSGIQAIVNARTNITLFDLFGLGSLISSQVDANGNLIVGGQQISLAVDGDEPHHALLGDHEHPGTVMSEVIANNLFLATYDRAFGGTLASFTDQEMLANSGIQ